MVVNFTSRLEAFALASTSIIKKAMDKMSTASFYGKRKFATDDVVEVMQACQENGKWLFILFDVFAVNIILMML